VSIITAISVIFAAFYGQKFANFGEVLAIYCVLSLDRTPPGNQQAIFVLANNLYPKKFFPKSIA